jgi:hypothetical protein
MIRMDQYGYIRTAYRVYQKSIKQICRETGHLRETVRETVRKVLRSEPFGYSPRTMQPYPVLGPYLPVIDQWLQEDMLMTSQKYPTVIIEKYPTPL